MTDNIIFALELAPGGGPVTVHVSQYDVSRQFIISLLKDGAPWGYDFSSITGIQIRGKKPDGHAFAYDVTHGTSPAVEGQAVIVPLQLQMTCVPGPVPCEIRLLQGEDTIGTATFVMMVKRAPMQEDDIISDSETSILRQWLDEAIQETGDNRAASEEAAETAETAKEAAVAAAETATAAVSRLDDYAKVDGAYDNLYAGTAGQLASDKYTEDSDPYVFRQTGGGASVGDREQIEAIEGMTVAWNQMVQNGNFAEIAWWAPSGYAYTVSGNVGTFTPSESMVYVGMPSLNRKKGHKYLLAFEYQRSVGQDEMLAYEWWNGSGWLSAPMAVAGGWQKASAVLSFDGDTDYANRVRLASGQDVTETVQLRNVNLFDLTQMFGTTIANYIYSLDSSDSGAGVAFFRRYFPKDYYPYTEPILLSVKGLQRHTTTTYPDGPSGEVKPYNYPLDSTLELRGIPELADGKLKANGDKYAPNGTLTRRYGIVDLGTLNWIYGKPFGGSNFFIYTSGLKEIAKFATQGAIANAITVPYLAERANRLNTNYATYDKCFAMYNNWVIVNDSAYTDAATFKAAMSGVMLVYESAEPTTETAEPYQETQICDPAGTEQFVTAEQSGVIVPVGHTTKYLSDLKGKLEALPDAAAADGTYLVKQTSGQMVLVPLTSSIPADPTANGDYVLKCHVSGGVVTKTWEVV